MILQDNELSLYLSENKYVDFRSECIREKSSELFDNCNNDIQKAEKAFLFVRDEIRHSWDIQSHRITHTASEVLKYKEGICYAKSMLLAALLRSTGIPTGFCYQRLTLYDTPESGYCVHSLNVVYLQNKWIRLDARGNKTGVNAQFDIEKEQLAFPVRKEYGEADYFFIYHTPPKIITDTLEQNVDCIEMMKYRLPEYLQEK